MVPFNSQGVDFSPIANFIALRDQLSAGLPAQQPQQGLAQTGGVASLGSLGGGLSPAEQWIIQRESGGRTNAQNPTSTAFGLGQLLDYNRKKYLGADWQTQDYGKQLGAFRSYVRDRYQTPEHAQQFWQQNGWY